jgi:carboxylesterase
MTSPLQNPHLEGGSFIWPGGAQGVLLIHGFGATTAEVRPLAKVIHESGYTLSGPLLPGHGQTPEIANQTHWQDWLSAAEASLAALQATCQKVFVAGESMGGLLALHLASSHPELAGVLLYAPAVRFKSRRVPLLAPLLAPFKHTVTKPHSGPSPADALWQGYQVYPVHALLELLALQRRVRRLLRLVRQPLFIAMGRADQSVHPATPSIIAARASSPWLAIHWYERSGHCVILDCQWPEIAADSLSFMTKISPGRI